jgi:hypothetical protein
MASTPSTSGSPSSGASTSDILTALKNVVIALNNSTQSYLNVEGITNSPNISVATVVKASSGRTALVSVLSAGTTQGTIYDATSTADTSKPLIPIPNYVGVFEAKFPALFGIVVSPGTGQLISVSYS